MDDECKALEALYSADFVMVDGIFQNVVKFRDLAAVAEAHAQWHGSGSHPAAAPELAIWCFMARMGAAAKLM